MNRREAIAALVALPAAATVKVARVEASDVIVVECTNKLTEEMHRRIATKLKDVWPNHRVVVLDSGMSLKVARSR